MDKVRLEDHVRLWRFRVTVKDSVWLSSSVCVRVNFERESLSEGDSVEVTDQLRERDTSSERLTDRDPVRVGFLLVLGLGLAVRLMVSD